jgi:gas vesicle protein
MSEFVAGLIVGAICGAVAMFLAGWMYPLQSELTRRVR